MRQKIKARGRATIKNTRNGIVERDAATGEATQLTKREDSFDLRGGGAGQGGASQTGKRRKPAHHWQRPSPRQTQQGQPAGPAKPPETKAPPSRGRAKPAPKRIKPLEAGGRAAIYEAHRKIYKAEQENVGTAAAHRAEMLGEAGIRTALRFGRKARKKKAEREQAEANRQGRLKHRQGAPQDQKRGSKAAIGSPQKRKIKGGYAKTAGSARKPAKGAKETGSATAKIGKRLAAAVKSHPAVAVAIIAAALLTAAMASCANAFGSAAGGGLGGALAASYLAEDTEIDRAVLAYTEWETDLALAIANAESAHPGYDEYRYAVGEISHDPYELMAFLTARHQGFAFAGIEAELLAIFGGQYGLTIEPSVETRYADPGDADGDGDLQPSEWKVLTITLAARPFSDVALPYLSSGQLAHYALLMQSKGCRQTAGSPFAFGWLPYVTSCYGYRVHPISGEKNLHLGVDIAAAAGTEILAAHDGVVTFAGHSGDFGNVAVIEGAGGLATKYAHCSALLVAAGQAVRMGDAIATVGSSGASTGPHLHFEVLKGGQYLNPLFYAMTGSAAQQAGSAGAPMSESGFAALIAEAELYLGYPFVWGGTNPSTGFDCSGFVSWVFNQSGAGSFGRLTAQGLYNISSPVTAGEARPGDLVFFHSTYSAPHPVTHVGIYVGGGRMIHAGNPVGYASINTPYWQGHFYAFGRITS